MEMVIGILITLVLALSVIYQIVREFILQGRNPQVPCVHQHVCDSDIVDDKWRAITIESADEAKAKKLEKMRMEYREWVDNCNYINHHRKTGVA